MLYGVRRPWTVLATRYESIYRPLRCPEDICPGVIVVRLSYSHRAILDKCFKKRLHHAVLHVCVSVICKINLKYMVHGIRHTCCRLVCRNRKCILRVKYRICRIEQIRCNVLLLLCLLICDNCKWIHLGARRSHSCNSYDRHCFFYLLRVSHQLPRISIIARSGCYSFGTVYRTSTTHRQYNLHIIFRTQPYSLLHSCESRVGFHTRKLNVGNVTTVK